MSSHCPICGEAALPGDAFCGGCGGRLTTPAGPPLAPAPPPLQTPGAAAGPPWYRSTGGLIGIGLGMAVVAVAAVVLIVRGSGGGTTEAGPNLTVPPTEATVATSPVTLSSTTTSTTASTAATVPVDDGSYSTGAIAEFMGACAADLGAEVCTCMLGEIEGVVPEADLLTFAAGGETPDSDATLLEAYLACLPPEATEPAGSLVLAETCTNEAWGFVIAYPEGWHTYEPPDSEDACRSYSPTGFQGWSAEEIADAPVLVWVAAESVYEDVIEGLLSDSQGFDLVREVAVGDRSGWLFEGGSESTEGEVRSFHSYVLPLWPDMDWGPPILFEAGGPPGSDELASAIAAIDAMVERALIYPYTD